MSGKALYSPAHDKSKAPPSTKRGRIAKKIVSAPADSLFAPGKSLQPTEAQRQELRRRQLQAASLPDPDLIPDHRREYRVDGDITHSEPRNLPPHPYGYAPGMRHTITLPDDPDTNLEEEEQLQRIMEQPFPFRFAATGVSALEKVATQIGQVDSALGNLRSSLMALKGEAKGSDSTNHHIDEMLKIVDEAMLPWLREVDEHAVDIVEDLKASRQSSLEEDISTMMESL